MSDLVLTSQQAGVLVLTINNPPVNALSPAVAEALVSAVKTAAGEESVRAIVVIGGGRTFIAGADIREFGRIVSGEVPPLDLAAQFQQIEDSPKPVVMAIHGAALGGGLETAMAGHYRLCSAEAQLGQPEIKLGLIPGAGGTQRLPRLVGVEKAMEMCAFGEPISAAKAFEGGLIDRVVPGDLLAGAIEFANTAAAPRRTRDSASGLLDAAAAESLGALFKETCGKRLRGQTAPIAAIDAVAATSRLSFDEGIAYERELFERCLHGPQSKAMIHLFFAERAVSKIPDMPKDIKPLPVRSAAVVGAGTMGVGIAMCFANAGIRVLLKEKSEDALRRGVVAIHRNYQSSVKRGKLSPERADERIALITPTREYEGFAEADIVVEAVFENLALKRAVFAELDQVMRAGAILASNTSTLDIDEIAGATSRPDCVVGMHFFSPANVMRLVEVVRGRRVSPQTVASAMDLARRMKKIGVVAGNGFGFIGNRMFAPYREQAVRLVEEGATPQQVDEALTAWGMAMGPLAVGDLAGLDVSWLIRQEALRRGIAHAEASTFEDVLYANGRYGQKTGEGWYRYGEDRQASPDPAVECMVREYAAVQGIPQRSFTTDEIAGRTLLALINEGARVLEEGIALRSVDIDVVYVNGYGFPPWRGGPMHYADELGLKRVVERIRALYDELGPVWKPAPLLERLAAEGKRFDQWSR